MMNGYLLRCDKNLPTDYICDTVENVKLTLMERFKVQYHDIFTDAWFQPWYNQDMLIIKLYCFN